MQRKTAYTIDEPHLYRHVRRNGVVVMVTAKHRSRLYKRGAMPPDHPLPVPEDIVSCLTPEASTQICECCKQRKLCKMYVLQTGNAAWVCHECREGK